MSSFTKQKRRKVNDRIERLIIKSKEKLKLRAEY